MEGQWETLFSVSLAKTAFNETLLCVKTNTNATGMRHYVDIRIYLDKRATKTGVCLRKFEYDWLMETLAKRKSASITGFTRTVKVLFSRSGGATLSVATAEKSSEINLTAENLKKIIENEDDVRGKLKPVIDLSVLEI